MHLSEGPRREPGCKATPDLQNLSAIIQVYCIADSEMACHTDTYVRGGNSSDGSSPKLGGGHLGVASRPAFAIAQRSGIPGSNSLLTAT